MKRMATCGALIAAAALVAGCAGMRERSSAGEWDGLPMAARQNIQKEFPNAAVCEVERKGKPGMRSYKVELKQDGKEIEVKVAADGTIIAIETDVAAASLPAAVTQALAKLEAGAQVREAEKQEARAEVRVVPLEAPVVTYIVEVKGVGKVRVLADGTIVKKAKEEHE